MMKKIYKRLFIAALGVTVCLAVASNSWAALRVNVMPSGVSGPTDSWDSGPYTWPTNTLELWGNVQYDGMGALTYTWDFGGAEGSTSGPVTSVNNIAVTHAYPNGSFVATLTVTDGTETDSDTVEIDVVPDSLAVRKNLAIQRGLKYQYMTRVPTMVSGVQGYYWHGQANNITDAALAVLAFENHGHLGNNDPDEDVYAETVMAGLNYMFYNVRTTGATAADPDSDINANGLKRYFSSTNLYDIGITTMALAGSVSPLEVVGPAGNGPFGNIQGVTYLELLEDMVDYIAYAQEHRGVCSGYGGWRYFPIYCSSDNSVTQWPVLALGEAEKVPWNVNAPAFVKTRMASWLDGSSQGADGGFGYTSAFSWRNVAKTGAGIAGLAYAGLENVPWSAGTKLSTAIAFMNTYWFTNSGAGGTYNFGSHYAPYAVKKGMEFADQPLVGAHDWQAEYDQWYVNNQYASGTWPGWSWVGDAETVAAFGLLVLAPLEVCKPIADAGIDMEGIEGTPVTLDGSGSFMTGDCATIDTYQWDCDYDGVNFDIDETGAVVSCTYAITNGTDTQGFSAALRVTDTDGREDTDTAIVTITNGNVAPVADTGGPYSAAVGENVTLDGSGSTDINACNSALGFPCLDDFIASYQWDLDGDGLYGTEDAPAEPEGVNPVVNFGAFIGTKTIGLKVTDSFGKSAAQSTSLTTIALSDLYPVGYELVSKLYNRRTSIYTVTWKMHIYNDGNGPATEVTAQWTPDSIPVGVTALDDTVTYTDPDNVIDAGETQTSGDADATFSYRYPRGTNPPDLTQITWDISYMDAAGLNHVIRGVLQ